MNYEEMDTEVLVKRVAAIKEQTEALSEEEEAIKAELRERLTPSSNPYEFGDYEVVASPNSRFSPAKAAALLTPAQLKKVAKVVPDAAKVKVLFPDVHAAAQDEGKTRLTIRPKED